MTDPQPPPCGFGPAPAPGITDDRLSSVLSEFARTLGTDFPIQSILDHLVRRIVDVLPISAAGVTVIAPGVNPRYVAASDGSAMRFEQLQTELGQGPCIAAYETGEAVAVPDLRDDDRFPDFAPRALEQGLGAVFTFPLRRDDNQLGALDLYRSVPGMLAPDVMVAAQTLADVAAAYLLNAEARAELQQSTERAHQMSLHDALTGLPNRTLLVQRLDHAILRCRRSGKTVAILFADLDGFKAVNDTWGHHVGDALLIAVAGRLTGLLRPGDTLARLAGDEFVILCEDLEEASAAGPLASRIGAGLAEPFVLPGAEVQISASVGIAFARAGDDLSERVLQDADTAMYQAKRRGGARQSVVDRREQGLASRWATLRRDLGGAVSRGELRTAYRPIVTVAGGRIAGVEALVRWAHPSQGLVGTETVLALAEQSGLVTEVGRWVLERACIDRRGWLSPDGHDPVRIFVNASACQFMSAGFAATVASVLSDTGTDPCLLTIGVTESAFIRDADRVLIVFDDLKRLGVVLALDDFGTGYSSLTHLKRFPVGVVKIDRSFIADLDRDPTSRLIVSAVVGLVHGLGMSAVAEGVESREQYDEVARTGCDYYQGFPFAEPMAADDLERLLVTPHSRVNNSSWAWPGTR